MAAVRTIAAEAYDKALEALTLRPGPVACTRFPYQSVGTASHAAMTRTTFWFPRGAKGIRLGLSGVYAGANETDFVVSVPAKFACMIEPAPWLVDRQYHAGDKVSSYAVSSGASANNPFFIAAADSLGSRPKPGNPDWTAGTRDAKTIPITFSGQQDGTLPIQSRPDGTTVTRGILFSDPLPVEVPVAGYLTIYQWTNNSSGLAPAPRIVGGLQFGNILARGAAYADYTASTALWGVAPLTGGWNVPFAIVGTPLEPTPTVAIIGDSIADGVNGAIGMTAAAPGIVSGGADYALGDVLTVNNAGGSIGAMAAGSQPLWIADGILGGALTALRLINTGGYTSTATQTGQTLPTGMQNLITLSGSGNGATCTVATSTNCVDAGDANNNLGWIARGLGELKIPYVAFTAPGDRANLWRARSYSRLAAIAASGATTAIVALGRNDLTAGDTAATIQANLLWLAGALKAIGVKCVLVATVTPETTSSSGAGQTTTAAQNVTANNVTRLLLNAWLREIPEGIDGCIDAAAAVEDGGAFAPTGKWAPIGGLAAAADGKHPGNAAILAMATALVDQMILDFS